MQTHRRAFAGRQAGRQEPGLTIHGQPCVSKLARALKLHLPVLSVDGTDAVAVYRVMQESILRGTHPGWNSGVIVVLASVRRVKAG